MLSPVATLILSLVRGRTVETLQYALQLHIINMGLDKNRRTLIEKLLFTKKTLLVLLLFTSIDELKDTERFSFRAGGEEHDSEVRINWRFRNFSWRDRRPNMREIVDEITVSMA